MDEFESLSHTKWECKYHVVFIPKCRRKTLYGELRRHLGEVFRRLAAQKESRIEEGHLMPDHVHYDDLDPAEICGVTGDRLHQRQERDPSGSGLRRKEAQLRRTAFLGQRVFRLDRRTGRGGDPVVHPEAGAGGQTPGSAQSVALISHLQGAKPRSGRVSDPSAASSGTSPKAPGFAGGYLLWPCVRQS